MATSTTKWLQFVGLSIILHAAAVLSLFLLASLIRYHQYRALLDPLFYVLEPLCLLGMPETPLERLALMSINTIVWGLGIGTAASRWFESLPKQLYVHALLVVTTLVAVLLGLVLWMASCISDEAFRDVLCVIGTVSIFASFALHVALAAKPRFSLHILFVATTLLAVVLGLAMWAGR